MIGKMLYFLLELMLAGSLALFSELPHKKSFYTKTGKGKVLAAIMPDLKINNLNEE